MVLTMPRTSRRWAFCTSAHRIVALLSWTKSWVVGNATVEIYIAVTITKASEIFLRYPNERALFKGLSNNRYYKDALQRPPIYLGFLPKMGHCTSGRVLSTYFSLGRVVSRWEFWMSESSLTRDTSNKKTPHLAAMWLYKRTLLVTLD